MPSPNIQTSGFDSVNCHRLRLAKSHVRDENNSLGIFDAK